MTKNDGKPGGHVPQRTCIACRQVENKKGLIRLVRTPDGVVMDRGGKLPGRGAYLHESRECWNKALSRGILSRSLKTELSGEDLERLKQLMNEILPEEK